VVGGVLKSVEALPVVPSNPEGEFWSREDRRGRGGQGGGWAYRGLVGAGGCWEGVEGQWEGSERLVLVETAWLPLRSTMDHQWEELVGEQRPGKSKYWERGGSGRPGPDCGDLEVRMGRGGRVRPSCDPND